MHKKIVKNELVKISKIYIGADHAGYAAKARLKRMLDAAGATYEDLGADRYDKKDDYPDYAFAVAQAVARSRGRARGIIICGSGVGADMVANKVKGVRSVLATTQYMAIQGVQHDHANVLTLGARVITPRQIERFARAFLLAKPSTAERHVRRVKKISNIEKKW